MKQADAKKVAEHLLGRKVKCKQVRGTCCIYPQSMLGGCVMASFDSDTRYYGITWAKALAKVEAHIRFTQDGQAHEGQLITCPNCGDSEHLDYDEQLTQFTCTVCEHKWFKDSSMTVVCQEESPSVDESGLAKGDILVPSGTDINETPTEGVSNARPIRPETSATETEGRSTNTSPQESLSDRPSRPEEVGGENS